MKRTVITLTLILALALGCAAMAEEVPDALPQEGADIVEEMPADAAPEAPDAPEAPEAPAASPTDDLKAAMDAYRAAKQDKALDDLEEELDGFVEEGSLTQAQADLILNSVKERIAAKNGECPNCGYKLGNGKRGRCGQQKQFPGQQKQFPNMQDGQNRMPGTQDGQNRMPGNRQQFPGGQHGNQMQPQDGQRPDAQSGATPRNGGRNHMPGMAPQM